MNTIDLGKSGLAASSIALGCMRLASLSEKDAHSLIETALDAGITLFDHADIYGGGTSEALFGKVLAGTPSLRERMLLQTKCGIREGYYDLSREHILASVEASLRRLHTDHLDLFLLHRPDTLMEPDEIAEAFDRLAVSGKVRYFGVSNMNPMQIELIRSAVRQKLLVNQLQFSLASSALADSGFRANLPSPVDSRDAGLLEYCRLRSITIQTWSPLQYGFFEGTFLGSEKYPALNALLGELGEKHSVMPGAIAVAWILRHSARMQVILGTCRIDRLAEYAKADNVQLTREEWYALYRAAGNELP